MAAPERILVAGPAWIGDMVIAQSLFKLLRQRQPDVVIDVVAPAWSVPVIARMPEVRRAIGLDVGHGELGLGRRWRLGRSLRDETYARAIVLPRSMKAALVPFFAGASRRTGFRTELRYGLLNDLRPLDRERLDQTVKRFLSLGMEPDEPLPVPPLPALDVDVANRNALMARYGLEPGGIALMPGAAYGPAKCWPLEYFMELAAALGERGRQIWVLGSGAERTAGQRIAGTANDRVINLCGQTRLEDAVDLLSIADAAVTNDSGLMHVAAAAGTRVLAIYGSSSPAYTPPLTRRAHILYRELDCSPCFKRECPLGHLRCLREITPSEVLQTLESTGGEE